MAYQGHIVIPTTHERADSVIEQTKKSMAVKFGGYSCYDGSGGWDGNDGLVTENHVRLVVNMTDDHRFEYETFKTWLEIEAMYVKDKLDEEAVLIEVHELDMELV